MSKMTDKDIIKYILNCENKDCRVIVIFNKPEDTIDEITIGDIADVINRQQAENNRQKAEIEKLQLSRKQKLKEIERLKNECFCIANERDAYKDILDTAVTDAIKEFAERLNKEAEKVEIDREGDFVEADNKIYDTVAIWCKATSDNILKEMGNADADS